MIKSQLTLNVAGQFFHLPHRVVEKAVDVVLDEIVTAMARKDRVELRGFGAFSVKDRAGRIGRNPQSGVKVEVPEKSVPVFTRWHRDEADLRAKSTPEHFQQQIPRKERFRLRATYRNCLARTVQSADLDITP